MMPKLRALFTGRSMVLSGMINDGVVILDSCLGRPKTMNSDFDWFRQRRFADIQCATEAMVF
jgi:hypothetical protein